MLALLRVGIVFGFFQAGMPLLGLLLGHGLAGTLGHAARWIGAALLIATGLRPAATVRSCASGRPVSRSSSVFDNVKDVTAYRSKDLSR